MNRNNFYNSQAALLTMESEEAVYEDPQFIPSLHPKLGQTGRFFTNNPAISPKKKNNNDADAVFKRTAGQVFLHPDSSQMASMRQWNSTKTLYPGVNDGRHTTDKRQNNPGTMPNVSGAKEQTRLRKASEFPSVPDRDYDVLLPNHNNNSHSKVDSCCQCCCFFLLYALIMAVAAGFFVLHVHYPWILDPHRIEAAILMENIKKDYGMLRRMLKAYCHDYGKMKNQTLKKFGEMCIKSFNKTALESYYDEE